VLLYRVFPYRNGAAEGEPGHPLYIQPVQGHGRWDNPSLYLCRYLATSPEAAIGEAFGDLPTWTAAMLVTPNMSGAERQLGVYHLDQAAHPLLDLDDPRVLAQRAIRPTHVVIRNRPHTQGIAADIYHEGKWAGMQWWSYHRPQWKVVALWEADITVAGVQPILGHPALDEAATVLAKVRSDI
jgi:RES domain-containing protein